ncbi:MAG: flagellar biosynthetic protein FliO [Thioalkalivibrionaceae bacterium]
MNHRLDNGHASGCPQETVLNPAQRALRSAREPSITGPRWFFRALIGCRPRLAPALNDAVATTSTFLRATVALIMVNLLIASAQIATAQTTQESQPIDPESASEASGATLSGVGEGLMWNQGALGGLSGNRTSSAWVLVQMLGALILVVGMILALAYVMRRLQGLPNRVSGDNLRIDLMGQRALGARERLIVIEVDGQRILLGVGGGRIESLHCWTPGAPSDPAMSVSEPIRSMTTENERQRAVPFSAQLEEAKRSDGLDSPAPNAATVSNVAAASPLSSTSKPRPPSASGSEQNGLSPAVRSFANEPAATSPAPMEQTAIESIGSRHRSIRSALEQSRRSTNPPRERTQAANPLAHAASANERLPSLKADPKDRA